MQTEKPKCPYCGSDNIIKKGFRYNKPKGSAEPIARQLYRCNNCKRRFSLHLPRAKTNYKDEIVKTAINLMKHLKVSQVQQILRDMFNIKIGRTTLQRWKKQFHHLNPVHKWEKLPDGTRQCKNCGMTLTINQYKRGKYPPCPKSPHIPKTETQPKILVETKITDFL